MLFCSRNIRLRLWVCTSMRIRSRRTRMLKRNIILRRNKFNKIRIMKRNIQIWLRIRILWINLCYLRLLIAPYTDISSSNQKQTYLNFSSSLIKRTKTSKLRSDHTPRPYPRTSSNLRMWCIMWNRRKGGVSSVDLLILVGYIVI